MEAEKRGTEAEGGKAGKSAVSGISSETEAAGPKRRLRLILFLLVAIGGAVLDLGTKRLMFDHLGPPSGKIEWIFENLLGFQTSLNEGALFGMGQGQTTLFIVASAVAVLLILVGMAVEAFKSRTLTVSLGLIVAGIIGNLWDRLALHGICWPSDYPVELAGKPIHAVRDWILVLIGSYHWPNFNLADSFLVAGTILICLVTFNVGPLIRKGISFFSSGRKGQIPL